MSPVDNQLLRSVLASRCKWSYKAAVIAATSVSFCEGGVNRTRRKRKGNRKRNLRIDRDGTIGPFYLQENVPCGSLNL